MAKLPLVISALICDQVLEEKDGVLSAIRIIDTYSAVSTPANSGSPKNPPGGGHRVSFGRPFLNMCVLVILKSGEFRGEAKIRLLTKSPSQKTLVERALTVNFLGDENGANLIFRGGIVPEEAGVHWFELYCEDNLLTRTPLLVHIATSDSKKTSDAPAKRQKTKKRRS